MSGLNLTKGQAINLTKAAPNSSVFYIGLAWPHVTPEIDLDVSAFVLKDGLLLGASHVCFYNQLALADGSIKHNGDNRSGSAPGDDESIIIDTSKIDPNATEVAIVITMHEDPHRSFKHLGTAEPTSIRVLTDDANGREIAKYIVTDIAPDATCLQFGSLMKQADGTWNFQAVGAGGVATLGEVISQYGL